MRSVRLVIPAVVLALAAGCSADAGKAEISLEPIADYPEAIAPNINAETGEIGSGLDRFTPSFYDANNLANVVEHVVQTCVVAHGFTGDLRRWGPADEVMKIRSSLGVWRVEDAERWAFMTPMSSADMVVNNLTDATMSESERAAARAEVDSMTERVAQSQANENSEAFRMAQAECLNEPEVAAWVDTQKSLGDTYGGSWTDEFGAAYERMQADPRLEELGAEYDACLAGAGLRPQDPENRTFDDFFNVEGQDFGVIDEQQITMAVAVVGCKTKDDLIERLLSVLAEYQAPVYLKYQAELDDCAAKLAQQRQEVAEYWAAHAQ